MLYTFWNTQIMNILTSVSEKALTIQSLYLTSILPFFFSAYYTMNCNFT